MAEFDIAGRGEVKKDTVTLGVLIFENGRTLLTLAVDNSIVTQNIHVDEQTAMSYALAIIGAIHQARATRGEQPEASTSEPMLI